MRICLQTSDHNATARILRTACYLKPPCTCRCAQSSPVNRHAAPARQCCCCCCHAGLPVAALAVPDGVLVDTCPAAAAAGGQLSSKRGLACRGCRRRQQQHSKQDGAWMQLLVEVHTDTYKAVEGSSKASPLQCYHPYPARQPAHRPDAVARPAHNESKPLACAT